MCICIIGKDYFERDERAACSLQEKQCGQSAVGILHRRGVKEASTFISPSSVYVASVPNFPYGRYPEALYTEGEPNL